MSVTANNWPVSSIPVTTWTNVVSASDATVLKSFTLSIGSASTNVQLRLYAGSTLTTFVPSGQAFLNANTGYYLNLPETFTLTTGQIFQIYVDQSGCSCCAFGAN